MDSTTMKGTVQGYFDRAFDEMTDKGLEKPLANSGLGVKAKLAQSDYHLRALVRGRTRFLAVYATAVSWIAPAPSTKSRGEQASPGNLRNSSRSEVISRVPS